MVTSPTPYAQLPVQSKQSNSFYMTRLPCLNKIFHSITKIMRILEPEKSFTSCINLKDDLPFYAFPLIL